MNLDYSSAVNFFVSFLSCLYTDVLTQFIIPGLNVRYWDLCIAFAVCGVVITGLISSVRIGSVIAGREARYARRQAQAERNRKD